MAKTTNSREKYLAKTGSMHPKTEKDTKNPGAQTPDKNRSK